MSSEESDPPTDQQRLFQAVSEGRVKKVRIILEASDGKLNGARSENGQTLLIASCFIEDPSSRSNMVEMMMDHKPDVNRRDLKGRTALSYASELGHYNVVTHLVRHSNVDPDAIDFKGNTPLIHAARGDQTEVVKLLTMCFRRLGLKVDHMNEAGYTALLTAAKHGYLECCRVLVHHGTASCTLRDEEYDLLPIEWMRKHNFSSHTIEFLRPKSRFYRVAKLATSFAKARSVAVFDKGTMLKAAQPKMISRSDSTEKKPAGSGCRSKPKRQTSEQGLTLSRRRDPSLKGDVVYSCNTFTPLVTTGAGDSAEKLNMQKKNSVSRGPVPVPKPRRRRSHKTRCQVSSLSPQTSTEREDLFVREKLPSRQESPQRGKAKGENRVTGKMPTTETARSIERPMGTLHASVNEMSWSSVSSIVTSVESLSLSDEDSSDGTSDEM